MKKAIRIFLLFSTGMICALLLGEAGLRMVGYSYPMFYKIDYDLGSSLRPGAEGLWKREGEAYIKINSDGLRDVEHSLDKPSDVLRIAVLGDSYAEGLQLPLEQLFSKVIEQELTGCSGLRKKVEVLNFGVSGYGTGRELLMLKKKVFKYQPDIVLLAFLTGNDVRNNSSKLEPRSYLPFFFLDDDGKLILDKSYLDSGQFKFRANVIVQFLCGVAYEVRLLQLAAEAWHKILYAQHAWARNEKVNEVTPASNELGLDNHVYLPPVTEEWKEGWEITEALLQEMSMEVKGRGASFLVVTLSNGIQVHPDQKVRETFMKRIGTSDLFYPDFRIKTFTEKNNIPVLILAPELLAVARKEQVFFHGFSNTAMGGGHWNADGHKLAGELISRKLCTLLQVEWDTLAEKER